MPAVYFIYSKNREQDKELTRDLHKCLSLNIDIIEAEIRKNKIVDINNSNNRKIRLMPRILSERERPILITEQAYDRLLIAYYHDSREPNTENKATEYAFSAAFMAGEIKIGRERIAKVIKDLRSNVYSWPSS